MPELSEDFENFIMIIEARIKPPLEKLEVDMEPVMGRIDADMGEMKVAMTKLNSKMKNELERVSDALGFGSEGKDSQF